MTPFFVDDPRMTSREGPGEKNRRGGAFIYENKK